MRYSLRPGSETQEEIGMNLRGSANVGLIWLLQVSARAVETVFSSVTKRSRDRATKAYLLRPRCCRAGQFWEVQ